MIQLLYLRLIRPILSAHDTPQAVAWGAAIGMGIGLTPTVGIQMPLAWLVATLFGANRVVAMALVWVSNPVTMLPMYYLEYRLGAWILGRHAISSFNDFTDMWSDLAQYDYLDSVRQVSETIGFPLLVGCFLPALLFGALSFPASLWLVLRHRRRRELAQDVRVDPEAPADAAVAPDKPGDTGIRRLQAGLLFLLVFPVSSCRDGRRLSDHRLPTLAELEGDVHVYYGELSDALLVTVTPVHSSTVRNQFTREALDRIFRVPAGTYEYLALHLLCFERPEVECPVPSGGIRVEVKAPNGAFTSLSRAELPSGLPSTVASLLGGPELPVLHGNQKLQLLAVMPGSASPEVWREMHVRFGESVLALRSGKMSASDLAEFWRGPSRDVFRQAFIEVAQASGSESAIPVNVDGR